MRISFFISSNLKYSMKSIRIILIRMKIIERITWYQEYNIAYNIPCHTSLIITHKKKQLSKIRIRDILHVKLDFLVYEVLIIAYEYF